MNFQSGPWRATRVSLVLSALGLAAPAAAQISTLNIHDTISAEAALEGVDPAALMTASAVGDLDNNLDQEIVCLVDGDLLIFMNVSVSTASFRLDLGQSAMALAIQSRENHPDRIVVAMPGGVEVFALDFDYATQGVTVSGASLYSQTELQSAYTLLVDDLDSVGEDDILVLGSDRQSLHVLVDDALNPGQFQLASTLQASTLAPVWSVDLLQADGDVTPEVAALGAHGLEILSLDDSAALFHPHSASEGSIAVTKASHGILAWARESTAGPMEMIRMEADGTVLHQGSLLAGSVSSMHAVELGVASAERDLVAVDSETSMLNIVSIDDGVVGPQYLIGTSRPPTPGNLAQLAIGDFDHDGFQDLALCDSAAQSLDLYLNDEWTVGYGDLVPYVYYVSLRAARDKLTWLFDDDDQGNPPSYPAGANRLSIRVFNMTPEEGGSWADPVAHPLPATSLIVDWASATHATFSLKAPGIGDDYIAFVEARFVLENAPNEPLQGKHPVYWFAIVDETNEAAIDYLEDAYPFQPFDPGSIGNGESAAGGTNPPKGHPPGPGGG